MAETKIIFFDIDGTLVAMGKNRISEKTEETLRKLQERGILICIATGRAPAELPHFEGVEFDAFLTYNGSYCFNKKETIFSNPIERKDVYTIIHNATEINRPLSLATKERLAANGRDQDLVEYYGFAGLEVEVAEDFERVAAEDEIFQVMVGGREEEYGALMHGVEHAKIASWWDRAVDIIPASGGKGVGIEHVLAYYHLDKSQAMAFGDGNNDKEMLQAVGCGIAMANASEELKKIADVICVSAEEDGIYQYCVEHGLI